MGRAVGPVVAPADDDVAAGEKAEVRSWRLEVRRKAKPEPLKTKGCGSRHLRKPFNYPNSRSTLIFDH
jgi:hypothetical protein